MKTTLAPKARTESQKCVTTLMEANHEHSTIFVPRLLNCNDVLSSNDWHFESITQPFSSHSNRSQIERVIQFPDDLQKKNPKEAETEATEVIFVDNNKGKVTGVDFSGDIPKVFYKDLPTSPTASDTLNPDQGILHKLWTHPDNQTKIKWYVATYTLQKREAFRDLWMADMRKIDYEIEFFKWFEMTRKNENQIKSLQMIINKWYTRSNKVVESITHPLEGLNIPVAGTIIKAFPFKEKYDKPFFFVIPADIDRVVEQNNYSNQILHVISRPIEDSKPFISRRPTPSFTSSSQNIEPNPGFKLTEFSREKFPKLKDTFDISRNVIDKINEQLSNFQTLIFPPKIGKIKRLSLPFRKKTLLFINSQIIIFIT
ncbi:hypothetical protein H5410_027092 [Solanum commersonii]|uniref:DUF7588 domain-containing protein n=1 Tax=Solanum commersonii TaxID=4109 RepID=A0A9J5Z0T1_SOLCO|nr:hypothetical protein H5410_027092 [Solanum commersonii]